MLHRDMSEDNSVGMRIAPNDDGGIVVKTKETAAEGQWIESGPSFNANAKRSFNP